MAKAKVDPTPAGFGDGPSTPKGKAVKEKIDSKAKGKFEVDLDEYLKFCDMTCSEESKDFDTLLTRYAELQRSGCNIQRLDTAASGLVAEAGEFMEIVKKLKFQGKPYDNANKEHLIVELGDVMWYAAQACMALGVRMEEVIYRNTVKLATRYPEGEFTVERSENRAEGDI
jgi:NTP pyrophosphatase (non-canonical NTP hydrolase)|tara:strand:- start:11747 stop:12259 length:513 start_codon:yes stop_codon:yes gene_type:complete